MDTILFTPASLIDLLSKIEELSNLDVGIAETPDGDIQLTVGDSVYSIDTASAAEVSVDPNAVEEVEAAGAEAYSQLDESIDVTSDETAVQSGVLKELAKSLLLGGMIRLSAKILK